MASRCEDIVLPNRPTSTRAVRVWWHLGREITWILVGHVVSVAGAVIGIRLVTHVLKPDSYGQLALGNTVALLASQTILAPLGEAAARAYAPAQEAGALQEFFRATQKLVCRVTAGLLGLGSVAMLVVWIEAGSKWGIFTLAVVGFALVSGYGAILDRIQAAARNRKVVALHQALGQWLRPLAVVLVAIAVDANGASAMLSYFIAAVVILSSQYILFRLNFRRGMDGQPQERQVDGIVRNMLMYAAPFASWGLFTWAQLSSDRWALQFFSGFTQVGLYSVALQIGSYPMNMLSTLMLEFSSPFLYSVAGDGQNPDRVNRALTLSLYVCGIAGIVMAVWLGATFFFRTEILGVFAAPEYRDAATLLPILAVGSCFYNLGQLASIGPMIRVSPKRLVPAKISTATLVALSNVVTAAKWGAVGVAVASAGVSCVYCAWTLALCLKSFYPRNS